MLASKIEKHVLKGKVKLCNWCKRSLPANYHLLICPKCRKESIKAYMKGDKELKKAVEITVARKE